MAPRDLSRPLQEVRFTVKAEEAGLRLDHWLASRVSWRSRNDLQRRIREHRILLDGRPARKSVRVQEGQEITVFVDEDQANEEVPVDRIPLNVLWEDRYLVALDKTPGVICHPVGRHVMDTIINALHARYRRPDSPEEDVVPMIVHRLDRDTSGVLVLAKDPAARKALGLDFETRKVEKSYLALVHGEVSADAGVIDAPIGPDPHSEIRIKVACVADGKPSLTRFEVVRRGRGLTLVRCHPKTGRQHQIRVHLAHLGHPILCDRLYGDPAPITAEHLDPARGDPDEVLLDRQALHAERLVFTHPMTGETIRLEAPLPPDLERLLAASAP